MSNNIFGLKEAMEIKKKREELKKEYEETADITQSILSQLDIETIENISNETAEMVKSTLDEVFEEYKEVVNDYKELYKSYQDLYSLLKKVAHTSDKLSYKEMLYIDFLDLMNANDGETYDNFKNYIGIVEKKPQIRIKDEAFNKAIEDIKFFHIEDDFLMNEYHDDMERDDGLDIFSCKNDFKKINSELKKGVTSN